MAIASPANNPKRQPCFLSMKVAAIFVELSIDNFSSPITVRSLFVVGFFIIYYKFIPIINHLLQ